MKVAFVTLATGEHCLRLADLVNPRKREYCNRYGYDFIEFRETLDKNRPPAWSKILAVLQVLPRYDWVLWHDSDTLIWDDGVGLRRFLADLTNEVFVVQADSILNAGNINTGVFFAKNSPELYRLFAQAYDQSQFNQHWLWEQIAIQTLLHDQRTTVPYRCIPYDGGLNLQAIYAAVRMPWSSVFLHLAGMRTDNRLVLAERLLRLAQRPEADRLYRREDLGDFLNRHHLLGQGVEVGVADGAFSETILNRWEGTRLHLVDRWSPDHRNRDQSQVSVEVHRSRLATATNRLLRFADRIQFHQKDSCDAATAFADDSLDFVYLDADHSTEAVEEDIAAWYPKVRPGGLLAGHDFFDGELPYCKFGVKTAVENWEHETGHRVASTTEIENASWYIFKR